MVLAHHVLDALPPLGRETPWRFPQMALTGGGRALKRAVRRLTFPFAFKRRSA